MANGIWSNVTTQVEGLKTTLENIQIVAAANAEVSGELLENPKFAEFCPHIMKNLLGAMKILDVTEEDESGIQ